MAVGATSCGVLVTDGVLLLFGHATGSKRWDIPKGLAEGDEAFEAAARRELAEETGLVAGVLLPLGVHAYRPGKRLALFAWRVEAVPRPETLACASLFRDRWGRERPEFDRFGVFGHEAALGLVGKAMAGVLGPILARGD
ncbi:MAG: NUDIX domain-containing protein [Janthinobacterium lividum]